MLKAIAFRVSLVIGLMVLFSGNSAFGVTSNRSPSYDDVTIFGIPSGNEISNNALVPEWKYEISIKLSSATPLADYQIKIVLNNSTFDYSKVKSDGGDIRFYDLDGNKLSYWIEEWNPTETSIIWVKIIVPRTSAISMYCGNEGATSESNGDATFDFFDDFDGSQLDPTKWNIVQNQGTIQVTNGYLRLYIPSGPYIYIQIESIPTLTGYKIIEYRQKLIPIGVSWWYFSSVYYGTLPNVSSIGYSTWASHGYESALSTQNAYFPGRCGGVSSTDGDIITDPPLNTWFTEEFIVPPGNLERILNETLTEYATRYQGVTSGKVGIYGCAPSYGGVYRLGT